MDVSIAIDFTLSNMEITDYRSLHRMNKGEMNQYEKAIFEVCNVMMPYAQDGMFKAYGFGGIPIYTGSDKVSRIWNLNGLKDAKVRQTEGVLLSYQKAIHGTKLAGPSYFAGLLNKIRSEIHENITAKGLEQNRTYSLLIIMTDGYCHDMSITKKLLVEMSGMPFSAVVVGVGSSDFADMEILDADEEVLADDDGNEAVRDIVQLVKYDDFKELGMRELAL